MARQIDAQELDELVNAVLSSARYKYLCPELIKYIGSREIPKWNTRKETLKAVKNKLHQVSGAYFEGRNDYTNALSELTLALQAGNRSTLQDVCKRIMANHASTRERLSILDQFYTALLADLAPIHSILDLACGLNPLAIPWMPLAAGARYYAYDIHQPTMDFLQEFLALMQIHGHAYTRDILSSCPADEVDVALVLKTIPCLEQLDKQAGYTLLRALKAKHLLVSFPVHSLGGKDKGMQRNYEAHFHALVAGEQWSIRRFAFPTELVFLVTK